MSLLQSPECSSQVNVNPVDDHGQTPLMITYESPIARETVALSQARTGRVVTKSITDEELPERHEYQDGLTCLQCDGGITPDEMNCSHCNTLIMRRYCSYCSKLIPDHAAVCPLCNKNVKEHFLYAKLRRTKILIGVGTAAIFILVVLTLVWQQQSAKSIPLQADTTNKPQMYLPDTKSTDAEIKPEAIKLSVPSPVVQKKIDAEEPVQPKVEESQPEIPQLAKAEEPPEIQEVEEPQLTAAALSAAEQRAVELKSEQRIRRGRILNHKGFSLIKEGRPSDAIPLLQQSVRSFPEGTSDVTYAYALFNLAVAYRMAGRPDIAIPILQERIKINNQRDVVARELLTAKRQAARLSGISESELN